MPAVSENDGQPTFAEEPASRAVMIVSEFLQSLRAGDTEAVLLRVDKAQLVLLLSSSDTIKTTIHPPRADLV